MPQHPICSHLHKEKRQEDVVVNSVTESVWSMWSASAELIQVHLLSRRVLNSLVGWSNVLIGFCGKLQLCNKVPVDQLPSNDSVGVDLVDDFDNHFQNSDCQLKSQGPS